MPTRTVDEASQRTAAMQMLLALRPEALAGWHVNHVRFYLSTGDIGANWGFNGGRIPRALIDMMTAFHGTADALTLPVWHAALWDMVREHLLPVMPAAVGGNPERTHPEVVFVETTGNPIRWASQERAEDWLSHPPATRYQRIDLSWALAFTHVHAHLTPHDQRDGEGREARS